LGSLGIDLLGRRRVQILQKGANGQLDTLDDWLNDNKLAIIRIPGLGDTIRESIRAGLNEYRPLIQEMVKKGVTVGSPAPKPAEAETQEEGEGKPFDGLSFCFTGTRAFLEETELMGGIIKSGISKKLDFLVQKDAMSQSNKTMKAESYGVKIISVDYLKKAIDGEVSLTQERD
jgi:NAD-dependent DNA ligase